MREVVRIPSGRCSLDKSAIFAAQGIYGEPPPRIRDLLDKAGDLFLIHAEPRGVYAAIGVDEFFSLYESNGNTPLHEIAGKAGHLALFIVTLGQGICDVISGLFAEERGDLAFMLDAAASYGAERLAELLEEHAHRSWYGGAEAGSMKTLRYSPGYCGWEITGQKKIFEFLKPRDIGVSLTESFFMEPLKSISGVLVAGEREIHRFENSYPFCGECKTRSCQERIRTLGGF